MQPSAVWNWKGEAAPNERSIRAEFFWVTAAGCAGVGAVLGLLAAVYREIIIQLPAIQELIRKSPELATTSQHPFWWLAVLAIGFAPPAEEYLFRGLLYRGLDREWGWMAGTGRERSILCHLSSAYVVAPRRPARIAQRLHVQKNQTALRPACSVT